MEEVTRSRSSTEASTSSGIPLPPPLPLPPSSGRNTPDETFAVVLDDIHNLVRSESFRDEERDPGENNVQDWRERSDSSHVDGHFTVINENFHETPSDDVTVIQHVQPQTIEVHHALSDVVEEENITRISTGGQEIEDIYTEVIRPTGSRVRVSSEASEQDPDWDCPPEVPPYNADTNWVLADRDAAVTVGGVITRDAAVTVGGVITRDAAVTVGSVITRDATVTVGGVMARVDQVIIEPPRVPTPMPQAPGNVRVSGEWQEMALQVGDDADFSVHPTGNVQPSEFSIYQTPHGNTTATIVSVDTTSRPAHGVSFTADTRDNEGQSLKRYGHGTEGSRGEGRSYSSQGSYSAGSEMWSSGTNVAPVAQPTGVALVMNADQYNMSSRATDQYNMSSGFSPASQVGFSGRVYPGTATLPTKTATVPAPYVDQEAYNQIQTFPRVADRSIQITDTDTWRRNPDNTSVITIDTDGKSIGGFSQAQSIPGWTAMNGGASRASLNKSGSMAHPTMLVTDTAFTHNKLQMNGTGNKGYNGYVAHDKETAVMYIAEEQEHIPVKNNQPTEMQKDRKKSTKCLSIEKRTKKCRIISFSIIAVILIAVIVALLVVYAN